MATLGDDCYFFCTSTCTKGTACPFRHVEAAKACKVICQHWQMGGCLRPMCRFRHSDFPIQVDASEVPCFWESQVTGCTKKNCFYKHSKPRPQEQTVATVTTEASTINADNATSQDATQAQVIPSGTQTTPGTQVTGDSVEVVPSQDKQEPNEKKHDVEIMTKEEDIVNKKKENFEEKSKNDSYVDMRQSSKVRRKKKLSKSAKTEIPDARKHKVAKSSNKEIPEVQKANHKDNSRKKKHKNKETIPEHLRESIERPRKNVKERLGMAPAKLKQVEQFHSESSSSGASSDSDDSIENIKVLSMEELLRQKALESMLKKRAEEGKSQLSQTEEKEIKNSSTSLATDMTVIQSVPKGRSPIEPSHSGIENMQDVESDETSSSGSSSEDETSLSREAAGESSVEESASSTSSSSSSSSSSTSSSSESDSSSDSSGDEQDVPEEPDVRRVVVGVESEKIARRKAKESLLRTQKLKTLENHRNRVNIDRDTRKNYRNRVSTDNDTRKQPLSLGLMKHSRGRSPRHKSVSGSEDYDSDDFASARVKEPLTSMNVRNRLGVITSPNKTKSKEILQSRAERFGSPTKASKSVVVQKVHESLTRATLPKVLPTTTTKVSKSVVVRKVHESPPKVTSSNSSSENEEADPLASIKIKTLEEIKQEKMRKLQAKGKGNKLHGQGRMENQKLSIKERLGKITEDKHNNSEGEGEVIKARQILLVNDSGSKSDDASNMKPSEDQRKAKKRPWRSQRRQVDVSAAEPLDQDTADSPEFRRVESQLTSDNHVVESPFERLKNRVLMKKLSETDVSQKKSKVTSVNTVRPLLEDSNKEDMENLDSTEVHGAGISKQKHGSKRHKRSKMERQIYMPPALKNTASVVMSSLEPEKSLLKKIVEEMPTAKVLPQKREPHPMAAAWAAGLSLSSKGTAGRGIAPVSSLSLTSSRRLEILEQPKVVEAVVKPTEVVSPRKVPPPSSVESSGVVIKSFAEIMAEKRKRRQELQAQKTTPVGSSVGPISSAANLVLQPPPAAVSGVDGRREAPSVLQNEVTTLKPGAAPLSGGNPGLVRREPDRQTSVQLFTARLLANSSGTSSLESKQISTTSAVLPTTSAIRPMTSAVLSAPIQTVLSSIPDVLSAEQKTKVASATSSLSHTAKRKKVKKLFKSKQPDQISSFHSEDSNSSLSSSSFPTETTCYQNELKHVAATDTFSLPGRVSSSLLPDKTSVDTHHMSSILEKSQGQQSQLKSTSQLTCHEAVGRGVVSSSPVTSTGPVGKAPQGAGSKHSLSSKFEPEATKKSRLSVDDEFNFFEDDDLDADGAILTDYIEPIDDLLQDIDDLLS